MSGNTPAGKTVKKRYPWWAYPPTSPTQNELDLQWGYLVVYTDGSYDFDTSVRPTDKEILNRTSCFLDDSLKTTNKS